jgi:hypothetical protein
MGKTYISAKQLRELGAVWKEARPTDKHALRQWGLVGFRLAQTRDFFLGEYDKFALTKSFEFCAQYKIPISHGLKARLINGEPQQGGLDFMKHQGQLDAAIFSLIFIPETTADAENYRWEAQTFGNYHLWTSSLYKGSQSWAEAAKRLGVKIAFIAGHGDTELGHEAFESPSSPYVTWQAIPSENKSFVRQKKPVLGVVIHRDYACELALAA